MTTELIIAGHPTVHGRRKARIGPARLREPGVALGNAKIAPDPFDRPDASRHLHDSSLVYTWSATHGTIIGGGSDVQWDFSNSPIGMQTLTVQVARRGQAVGSCTVQVLVVQPGPTRGRGDLIARALLLPGARELQGYGLYSYLLLGSRPSDPSRALYRTVIAEYVRLMPDINQFAEKFEGDNAARRKENNVCRGERPPV